jgi:hypothetical protein
MADDARNGRDRHYGRRALYVALVIATMLAGLAVHWRGAWLGAVAKDVVGDALWAAMIAWWAGAVWPVARPAFRAAVAFGVCVAVELSQLWHTPLLDAVRQTQWGHLMLGSGFDPRDFAAYALGVAGAWVLDVTLIARGRGRRGA